MPIENVKLSQSARDQLVQLKRHTRIENWNILCRWGLCLSLAEPSAPRRQPIPSDSNVEMTWRTFGGHQDEIYRGLLTLRYQAEAPEDMTELEHFRLHLHRGISYLAGDPRRKSIAGLLEIASEAHSRSTSPS